MSSAHDLIVQLDHYGHALFYVLTFCWTALEGESFVVLAGYLAHKGLISFPLLLGCAWLGSFCGDQVYFYLGRRYGTRLITRFPRWRPGTDKALSLIERNATWFILTFRFIYGIRNVSSFALGLSAVTRRRFLALNLLGSLIWGASFIIAGYVCGGLLGMAVGNLAEELGLVLLGGFVVGVALVRLTQRAARRALR